MMRVADRCRDGITGPKRNEAEGLAHLPPRARIDRSFTASFSSIWAKQEIAVTKRPYSNRGQFANPENGKVVDIGHSSGNPLSSTVDEILSRPQGAPSTFGALTMSSFEIADLVGSRHDSVKRAIERIAGKGVISLPPLVEVKIQRQRRAEPASTYVFSGERGKRDSIIVVAQLCPEFTANLVDRWCYLEQQVAARKLPATSHEVTVTGLEPEALGQVGGVMKNVSRAANRDLVEEINRCIDQKALSVLIDAVPRLEKFVEQVAGDILSDFAATQKRQLESLLDEAFRRREECRDADEGPIALPRMSLLTFRKMRGWSLQKMGEMVGVTASAVAKHERGLCIPAPFVVYRYSQVSGGRLTTDTFYDAYRARWGSDRPRSKSKVVIEGEGA